MYSAVYSILDQFPEPKHDSAREHPLVNPATGESRAAQRKNTSGSRHSHATVPMVTTLYRLCVIFPGIFPRNIQFYVISVTSPLFLSLCVRPLTRATIFNISLSAHFKKTVGTMEYLWFGLMRTTYLQQRHDKPKTVNSKD